MSDNEDWGKEYSKLAELYAIKCNEVRELKEENKQIRAEAIEEYKKALLQAFNETNINDYGFYPQNVVDMVAIKLKEQNK